uniref:Uncharacterized protein n=1 Tax=Oryza brachyantha TaxID=4533 RepID=J3LT56_ORYBR
MLQRKKNTAQQANAMHLTYFVVVLGAGGVWPAMAQSGVEWVRLGGWREGVGFVREMRVG